MNDFALRNKTFKKILVVNVNWLGDVIFSSPLFRALKSHFPGCHISCLAPPRVQAVLECIPDIDEKMVLDEKGEHGSFVAKCQLIWEIRQKRFDAVFLLHRSMTRAFLVWMAGIPVRVGYDLKNRGAFLSHRISPLTKWVHRLDYYLNVMEALALPVVDRTTYLQTPEGARQRMVERLNHLGIKRTDYLVVIHAGGNWDLKRWPSRYFSKLVDRLHLEYQAQVILTGTEHDVALVKEISSGSSYQPFILAGQTDLHELMAVMELANLVISADSGPLHIAHSLGKNCIALFGPTRPEVTGPRGKGQLIILQKDVGCNRNPCYHLLCHDNICMQSITVDDVIKGIQQLKNK